MRTRWDEPSPEHRVDVPSSPALSLLPGVGGGSLLVTVWVPYRDCPVGGLPTSCQSPAFFSTLNLIPTIWLYPQVVVPQGLKAG